mmetsp:Transcript_2825/g.5857  ORF Transcript_2825/g.5857 Transcript_2825/m.5857 type:complete len:350 (+) Transcript_2825:608-1657(+)
MSPSFVFLSIVCFSMPFFCLARSVSLCLCCPKNRTFTRSLCPVSQIWLFTLPTSMSSLLFSSLCSIVCNAAWFPLDTATLWLSLLSSPLVSLFLFCLLPSLPSSGLEEPLVLLFVLVVVLRHLQSRQRTQAVHKPNRTSDHHHVGSRPKRSSVIWNQKLITPDDTPDKHEGDVQRHHAVRDCRQHDDRPSNEQTDGPGKQGCVFSVSKHIVPYDDRQSSAEHHEPAHSKAAEEDQRPGPKEMPVFAPEGDQIHGCVLEGTRDVSSVDDRLAVNLVGQMVACFLDALVIVFGDPRHLMDPQRPAVHHQLHPVHEDRDLHMRAKGKVPAFEVKSAEVFASKHPQQTDTHRH